MPRTKQKKKQSRSRKKTYNPRQRRNRAAIREFKNKFESRISEELHAKGVDPKYETFKIDYILKKTYTPDFLIEGPKGRFILEAKGLFDAEDRRKHREVREQHPEYDIRLVFYADHKISKRSKTRYSGWCEKNNFKYAVGHVPDEWLKEIGINE